MQEVLDKVHGELVKELGGDGSSMYPAVSHQRQICTVSIPTIKPQAKEHHKHAVGKTEGYGNNKAGSCLL
jgi:hypothetical protein